MKLTDYNGGVQIKRDIGSLSHAILKATEAAMHICILKRTWRGGERKFPEKVIGSIKLPPRNANVLATHAISIPFSQK